MDVKEVNVVIVNRIIELRGKKVMLDRDLAELYGVTTKRLNEQVKRNLKRFPLDFMFQLTQAEKEKLIQDNDHLESMKFSYTLPYVFTEHGAVMLASVLNSEIAIEMNIQIVRAFIELRKRAIDSVEIRMELEKIKTTISNQGQNIDILFHHLNKLLIKEYEPREQIGYKN